MAADSGQKPLQNAMKMAKTAIQLDGGNRHKVKHDITSGGAEYI
uniref:Uncharacterized protein n=1 Tax=Salarias fasciatus TaxID=181472 RepID=A0A672JE72_SALFA